MWSPTHVQVTVQKARGLITKGKHGTNNAFVTIALGKDKYQTSLKEKATESVEWHEKCELQIPKQGNTAEITLTALHHNFVGVDEFLGYISIPLAELDVYERPKNKWYKLKDKPGKDKKKDRGELEVKVAFIVKSGSLADLSKKEKHKSSVGSLAFSGSLISISSLDKRKGLKKLASKIGKKVKRNKNEENNVTCENQNLGLGVSKQVPGEADPGVISEGESEDDFTLDELSHKGSGCSLEVTPHTTVASTTSSITPVSSSLENLAGGELLRRSSITSLPTLTPPMKPPRVTPVQTEKKVDEWEQKLYGKHGKEMKPTYSPLALSRNTMERIIIGGETEKSPNVTSSRLSTEIMKKFEGKSREDLIELVVELESKLNAKNNQQKDLEDYLDNLLLRVMETSPRILQNPYISCKTQAQII